MLVKFPRLLALLSVFATVSASLVFHEARTAPPNGFVSKGPAPAYQSIELRIGLTSNNINGLQSKLMSISTPGSEDFRQWLSADEVKSFMQPSSASVAAVNAFAETNNLNMTSTSPNGDWVSFTTSVGHANMLFGANYETFAHESMAQPVVRTLSVSLPSDLVGHVDVVHPSTSFADPSARLSPIVAPTMVNKRAVPESCNSTITPSCLQELYGIPTTPATEQSNTLLVTAYQGESVQNVDVESFLELFRPDIDSSTTFTLQSVDNGTNPQDPADAGQEADLDVEYTIGIATGVPVTFLANGNGDFNTALVDSANYLVGIGSPPSVVTTSYGGDEDSFSSSLAIKLCDTYSALGARGISVVYASGDGGVRGLRASLSECANATFTPVFPASCPFVTAVGSTIGINPERAINFTGGGFSNLFSQPSYQSAVVAQFLETLPSDFPGVFNSTGRGYPDVATQGWNFEVIFGGEANLDGGTSASSPVFASIIALINDKLVAAGKPVLGFLNPFIYSNPDAFKDVTVGKNVGFACTDASVAFTAVEGWDPLTGFGTPIFPSLLAAAQS